MSQRGAFNKGNTRGADLTAMQVLEIREKYTQGQTQGSLAREYGMSVGHIGRIVRGEVWQTLYQPEHPKDLALTQAQGTLKVAQYDEQASVEKLQNLLEAAQRIKDAESEAESALDELKKNPYY